MPITYLADTIHRDPWRRLYRNTPVGRSFTTWPQRLKQYGLVTSPTPDLAGHLVWLDQVARDAALYSPSNPKTSAQGHITAAAVLRWGGVTRGNLSKVPAVLPHVVTTARSGLVFNKAPMNSGWTKVAAVFAYHTVGANPQVIWDSRVSLSICSRLRQWAQSQGMNAAALQARFPELGWVPGRSRNRLKLIASTQPWFPNRYRYWSAHFAGGQVASKLASHLNQHLVHYGSPSKGFGYEDQKQLHQAGISLPIKWTPWLVACVLFMDGQ